MTFIIILLSSILSVIKDSKWLLLFLLSKNVNVYLIMSKYKLFIKTQEFNKQGPQCNLKYWSIWWMHIIFNKS